MKGQIEKQNVNVEEMLKYIQENCNIDIDTIQYQMEMKKRNEILEKHNIKIWQGKNCRWFCHIPNPEKGRKLVSKKTKEEVEDVIINYFTVVVNQPCFPEAYKEWLVEKEENLESSSITRYRNDYKRFFGEEKIFCKIKLCDMTDEIVAEFIKRTIREKELSRKAYKGMLTILMGVFKYSKEKKYTKYSISTFINDFVLDKSVFTHTFKDKENETFTELEITKIINYIKENSTNRNLAVLLQIYSGLRVGELTALKPEDINWQQKKLYIHRTEHNYYNKELNKRVMDIKNVTKTENGCRYVIVPTKAMETIKTLKNRNTKGEYLLMDNGKRITSKMVNYTLQKICKEIGIKYRSSHKIRRYYASKLLNEKVDSLFVQNQLGHKDIYTTEKYYYFDIQQDDEKQKTIDKVLAF